jgi:hypothetical protein
MGGADGRESSTYLFSRLVQPIRHRATTMWMYPGPSYPDCPFSEELYDVEINTWIHMVLAHRVDLSPWAGLAPLREGVNSTTVNLFAFTLAFAQFDLLMVLVSAHRVSRMLVVCHGGSPYLRT